MPLHLVKPQMESRLKTPTSRRELRPTICNVLKVTNAVEVPTRALVHVDAHFAPEATIENSG